MFNVSESTFATEAYIKRSDDRISCGRKTAEPVYHMTNLHTNVDSFSCLYTNRPVVPVSLRHHCKQYIDKPLDRDTVYCCTNIGYLSCSIRVWPTNFSQCVTVYFLLIC